MPKTRFTAADVAAAAACVRASCLGRRVANVYDLNARTFLLKLQAQGGAPDTESATVFSFRSFELSAPAKG